MNHSNFLFDDICMFRRSIAKHPNTPPTTLEFLATDGDPMVRFNVIHNPNTPPNVLELLSTDNDDIRLEVTKHLNTTLHQKVS